MEKKKLKTLNDLQKEADELSFGGYTIDTLREEAVKWSKKECASGLKDCPFCLGKNMFIEMFFNLTEEDLK